MGYVLQFGEISHKRVHSYSYCVIGPFDPGQCLSNLVIRFTIATTETPRQRHTTVAAYTYLTTPKSESVLSELETAHTRSAPRTDGRLDFLFTVNLETPSASCILFVHFLSRLSNIATLTFRRRDGAVDVSGGKDAADVGGGGNSGARHFLLGVVALVFLRDRIFLTAHDTAEQALEAADRKHLLADFAKSVEELVAPSHVDDEVDGRVDDEEEIVEFPSKLLR